jgi:hypothetical protein
MAPERLYNIPGNKALFMTGKGDHYMGVYALDSIITAKNSPGLHYKCMIYPDETHRTIGLKTIYDGLKYSYDGYAADIAFGPNSGMLLKSSTINVRRDTEPIGYNIRYTTDGSEPSESSPEFDGFDVTEPTILKIKLFSATGRYNQTVSGNFESGNIMPSLSAPGNIKPGGLHFDFYKGEWINLPEFNNLKPDSSGCIGYVKKDEGTFSIPNNYNGACHVKGYIEIKEDGYYGFLMHTKDIAKLFIGDKLIITSDKKLEFPSYMLPLEKGFYPFRMECIVKKGVSSVYLVYYKQGDKWVWKPVPSELLYSDADGFSK